MASPGCPQPAATNCIGFPEEGSPAGGNNLCWIRQDWLDKVGLPLPTTVAELDETMRAFMDAGSASSVSAPTKC